MLVQQIHEFIESLTAIGGLYDYDLSFLRGFTENFSHLPADTHLDPRQLKFVQEELLRRWDFLKAGSDNYTKNQSAANTCWVKLAQNLSADTPDSNFFQYLLPTINNLKDPHFFQKFSNTDSLDGVFMSDDQRTLFSIVGLMNYLQRNQRFEAFNTYDDNRLNTSRPFSIVELGILRNKKVTFYNFMGDKRTLPVWEHLELRVMPGLKSYGEVPKYLLTDLLKLVELYYIEMARNSFSTFKQALIEWSTQLKDCEVDDVNCLYGQSIQVDSKKSFLINVFLDCLRDDPASLTHKIRGIAEWLTTQDATLLANSRELSDLYATLKVGPAFGVPELKDVLGQINVSCSHALRVLISPLLRSLGRYPVIDKELAMQVKKLFDIHWGEIKGTPNDYTQSASKNAHWVRLAQQLFAHPVFKNEHKDYFTILMPNVILHHDLVTKEMPSHKSLGSYLLAESNRELIDLPVATNYYKKYGVFKVCSDKGIRSFTDIEIDRLSSNPRYRQYVEYCRQRTYDDLPVSRDTIKQVYRFIQDNFQPHALASGQNYSKQQEIDAQVSFTDFIHFLEGLEASEKARLFSQRIKIFSKDSNDLIKVITFKMILDEIKGYECLATCCLYMAQLVIDYEPCATDLIFNERIEAKVTDYNLRALSACKAYRAYEELSDLDIKRHLSAIFISLLSYPFDNPLPDEDSMFWDCSNRMVPIANEIMKLFNKYLRPDGFKDHRFLYSTIMESIVKPALANSDPGFLRTVAAHPNLIPWLHSIRDGSDSSFRQYKPALFLVAFEKRSVELSEPTNDSLQNFIKDLLQTYAQPHSQLFKRLRINILFAKVLNHLVPSERLKVLSMLQVTKAPSSSAESFSLYSQAVATYLAQAAVTVTSSDSACLVEIHRLRTHLLEGISRLDHSKVDIKTLFVDLLTQIECMDPLEVQSRMREYLESIQRVLLPWEEPAPCADMKHSPSAHDLVPIRATGMGSSRSSMMTASISSPRSQSSRGSSPGGSVASLDSRRLSALSLGPSGSSGPFGPAFFTTAPGQLPPRHDQRVVSRLLDSAPGNRFK